MAPVDQTALIETARRLVALRQALGHTQAQWARRNGFEPQVVNNWEAARNRIGLDAALKICSVTGVTLDYIYRGSMAALPWELAAKLHDGDEASRPKRGRRRPTPAEER
jgi:transcriptional regulator with XRE-family HTH domain